jgi:hypothetical protein
MPHSSPSRRTASGSPASASARPRAQPAASARPTPAGATRGHTTASPTVTGPRHGPVRRPIAHPTSPDDPVSTSVTAQPPHPTRPSGPGSRATSTWVDVTSRPVRGWSRAVRHRRWRSWPSGRSSSARVPVLPHRSGAAAVGGSASRDRTPAAARTTTRTSARTPTSRPTPAAGNTGSLPSARKRGGRGERQAQVPGAVLPGDRGHHVELDLDRHAGGHVGHVLGEHVAAGAGRQRGHAALVPGGLVRGAGLVAALDPTDELARLHPQGHAVDGVAGAQREHVQGVDGVVGGVPEPLDERELRERPDDVDLPGEGLEGQCLPCFCHRRPRWPVVVGRCQPSAVSCQPSAVDHQPCAASRGR